MSSSRTPSTPSEGEIVEDSISDTEKATTSLPSVNGTSVNRSTRPRASPAPPALPRSSAPPQSIRSPRRDRSRSPYRERRGEKRRRDDEFSSDRGKTDSRRYNPRYEGRQYDDRRQQRSYADLDRGDTVTSHMRYDDDDRRYRDKRPRTRSRSPFLHGRRNRDEPRKSRSPYRHDRDRTYSSKPSGPTSEQSVSERGRPSVVAHKSKHDAESRGNQVQQDIEMSDASNQADRYEWHASGDRIPLTLLQDRKHKLRGSCRWR
jgi:serine/threonine-protein kinase PRP4